MGNGILGAPPLLFFITTNYFSLAHHDGGWQTKPKLYCCSPLVAFVFFGDIDSNEMSTISPDNLHTFVTSRHADRGATKLDHSLAGHNTCASWNHDIPLIASVLELIGSASMLDW
jgi:hypothetical protein